MSRFDMVIHAPAHVVRDADAINDQYFTIDTADLVAVHEWIRFNPLIVTYALDGEEVMGFFNIIPITAECAALFDQQMLKEEDLTVDHILAPDVMHLAKYAYLAAIAVKDNRRYRSRQCAAALLSALCAHLMQAYDLSRFERLYANPTTFNGNHLVRKLGLRPVVSIKKPLTGNDIYAAEMTEGAQRSLHYLEERYRRFIGASPWKNPGNATDSAS